MNIELPKDAEGREIPLDTKALYDGGGNAKEVQAFDYSPVESMWRVLLLGDFMLFLTYDMHLTPPDSWEKLLDDLDNAAKGGDNAECLYSRREDVANSLADLINPTCFDTESKDSKSFTCSACRFSESKLVVNPFTLSFFWVKPSYRYCPNCGAEVIDD